ncbi:MAG: hypothetical protein Q3M30_05650 [Candidatus Electrothrix sp. Rat3]|nr:hypothetical protein [Candidatus Electrothrix rattekaaiensis]
MLNLPLVEDAFGLISGKRSVSLDEMEEIIRKKAGVSSQCL